MSSNKDEEKKEFTIEEQNDAYLELCYYIKTAVENGDFTSLEPLIALWESKYPLDKFTDPEVIRKIKAILNKDYLSRLVGDYLASQVLHEQQKQKEFYDRLTSIITTAEKSKDYKTAKKEITVWKNDLHSYGFSIYDFNKRDLKNILDWISLPAQKLREHSATSKSLNELLNNSNKLNSKQLSEEIKNWKGKHPLSSYSTKSRKDMEEILKSLEKLVSQKDTEESAIQKMQDYLSSEEKQSPAEEIPKLLAEFNFSDFSDEAKSKISDLSCKAMSLYSLNCVKDEPEITKASSNIILAYQQDALNELREIIKKDKKNYADLFNWIYLHRKTAFSPEAIEEIKKSFIEGAGFDIPKQGKYSISLEYFNKALAIREKVSGTEDPKVAAYCHNIGNVSSRLGDYPKALEYLNRALNIREKLLGLEHPDIAMSYNSIGGVYSHQGNDSKALEYLSKALTINEKIYGSKHPIVAASYNNVGYIYSRQGECPKALEYYNKALAIREKLFGPEHPDVAMSYNNIGIIYHKQDDFTKALEYYEQAQAIWEKVYGKEHPSVAKSYNNIGTLYDKQGDYSKALEYYEKALTIYEKVYGKEHPDVASSYSNIGGIYYDRGDYPKALDYLGKALAIYEKVFGMEHPTTKFISDTILSAKYKQALLSGNLSDFLSRHAFTVTVDDGDTPAGLQGMSGEYYLLEFADWTQESGISMYDKTEEMKEKAKDILVLKDGVVNQYHFDDTIGAQYGIKDIGKEERQRINKTYENWKKQNRK